MGALIFSPRVYATPVLRNLSFRRSEATRNLQHYRGNWLVTVYPR